MWAAEQASAAAAAAVLLVAAMHSQTVSEFGLPSDVHLCVCLHRLLTRSSCWADNHPCALPCAY